MENKCMDCVFPLKCDTHWSTGSYIQKEGVKLALIDIEVYLEDELYHGYSAGEAILKIINDAKPLKHCYITYSYAVYNVVRKSWEVQQHSLVDVLESIRYIMHCNFGSPIDEDNTLRKVTEENVKYLECKENSEIINDVQSGLQNNSDKAQKEEEIDKFNINDFNCVNRINTINNIRDGYKFEHSLDNIFNKLGYESIVTKASGDQGADLIIIRNGIKTVVQSKYYTGSVGNKAVQEVYSAINFYNANNAMVVTNSIFTKSAVELAKANNIILIDGIELYKIISHILVQSNIISNSKASILI